MTQRGKFITFDGIDGAGKTTQITRLGEQLRAQGHCVHITREPGGTLLGEKIRQLLLNKAYGMHSLTELLLMFAARAEHIETILKPKLIAGEWIICSRFSDATMAYQGYARGQALNKIQTIIDVVHGDFQPDISFFLDLPVPIAKQRRNKRDEAEDRFETETNAFMEKVREGYLAIAKKQPRRCRVIDATESAETTAEAVAQHINQLM